MGYMGFHFYLDAWFQEEVEKEGAMSKDELK